MMCDVCIRHMCSEILLYPPVPHRTLLYYHHVPSFTLLYTHHPLYPPVPCSIPSCTLLYMHHPLYHPLHHTLLPSCTCITLCTLLCHPLYYNLLPSCTCITLLHPPVHASTSPIKLCPTQAAAHRIFSHQACPPPPPPPHTPHYVAWTV